MDTFFPYLGCINSQLDYPDVARSMNGSYSVLPGYTAMESEDSVANLVYIPKIIKYYTMFGAFAQQFMN